MSSSQIFVTYRTSTGDEIKVQGEVHLVQRFVQSFLEHNEISIESAQTFAPEPIESNNSDDTVQAKRRNSQEILAELPKFYRKHRPDNQMEQVLFITYFYHINGIARLALSDYEQAYDALKKIPVEKPRNMKSSVRNVVDRTEYLRNADRGRYMLTVVGEEHVQNLIASREGSV